MHGKDIVNRGLIVLFFGLYFFVFPLPPTPPEKFSADALASAYVGMTKVTPIKIGNHILLMNLV